MTVYELIQELTNYEPNTDVEFNVKGNVTGWCDIDVDLNGEDTQTHECELDLDEPCFYSEITDKERTLGSIIIEIGI